MLFLTYTMTELSMTCDSIYIDIGIKVEVTMIMNIPKTPQVGTMFGVS